MKFAIVALIAAAAVNAELVFDEATGTFQCLGDSADKNFCAGDSLSTNIIIRCTGARGQPGNCNNNLAGVPPVGVKTSAVCWQSSNTTGDGACSFNGIVYADDGSSFPVPGYGSSSSSSAPEPTYGATTSTEPEPTYAPSTTEDSSVYYPTVTYSNTTTTDYPPPSSTLVTVTGTTTITTCDTTTTPAPTNTYVPPPPPPPSNTTSSYTTGLPTPTQSPSGAGALLAKDSLVLGVVALIGFMFL